MFLVQVTSGYKGLVFMLFDSCDGDEMAIEFVWWLRSVFRRRGLSLLCVRLGLGLLKICGVLFNSFGYWIGSRV